MTVYFAATLDGARVKIGFAADAVDPAERGRLVERRLKQLGWLYGLDLELLAVTAGKRRVERWFHLRHAASAVGREWFRLTPQLAADIECLKAGRSVEGQPEPYRRPHFRFYREWIEKHGENGRTYWLPVQGFKWKGARVPEGCRLQPMVQP